MVRDPSSLRRSLLEDRSLRGTDWARAYSNGVDHWLTELSSPLPPVALLALGGYGRRELCPWSDLDLMLVHDRRVVGRALDEVAEAIWYPIWDLGVVLDHSVKTRRDALSVANDDPRALLGQLDARLIVGDAALAQGVIEGAHEHLRKHLRRLSAAIEASVVKRHAASGDLAYLLEPDLKDSQGGLRDLNIVRSFLSVMEVPNAASNLELNDANDFLLTVRVELHRQVDRATDRLGLEEADSISMALGFTTTDAFMRRVSEYGRLVSSSLRECLRRTKVRGGTSPRRHVELGGIAGTVLAAEVVDAMVRVPERSEVIEIDPLALMRLARRASIENLGFDRLSLEYLAAHLQMPPNPWPQALLAEFLGLLGSGAGLVEVVQALDGVGIFQWYIPDWGFVRSKPQRNAYHRYSVDRHLLETILEASRLRRRVHRPDILLLAALFHDLGKGLAGDHSENGVRIVRDLGPMMGLNFDDQSTLERLVLYHLLLIETALRRDISDPVTLASVAEKVVDLGTLELLVALTEADLKATGALAWTEWKAGLVHDLSEGVKRLLVDGELVDHSVPIDEALLCELVALGRSGAAISVRDGFVFVAAPDRPGLLAAVTGALTLASIAIASADILVLDEVAIERLRIVDWSGGEPNVERFKRELAGALVDEDALRKRILERGRQRRPVRRSAPLSEAPAPRVVVDPAASQRATVVEVLAPDRHGLLYDLTSAIARLGFDIRHAKVATLGDDVIDTFYLTNASRAPLGPDEQESLLTSLTTVVG